MARSGTEKKASHGGDKGRWTTVARDARSGQLRTTKEVFGYRQIAQGVPATVVGELAHEGLTRGDVHMVIPERTLARRLSRGEALTIDEADALARLRRVVAMARRVFCNAALADEWLRSPNPALEGEVPIRMARTDLGGREVEAVLGRIEHGVYG